MLSRKSAPTPLAQVSSSHPMLTSRLGSPLRMRLPSPPHRNDGSFWLTLWSISPSTSTPTLDLVLSCVNWTLGNYPIFLWTPKRQSTLSTQTLMPRIRQLAEHLQRCVPVERVFSVFGMTPLVTTFASCWSAMTGYAIEAEPFYAAYFSFCNANTFKNSAVPLPRGDHLRRAVPSDLESVAQLCKEFADDSVRSCLAVMKCPRMMTPSI